MPLSDKACRELKAESSPRKYSDGGGLFLLVNPNGSKLWRLAYRFDGKQKTLAFGAYPSVSLASARGSREMAKRSLAAGFDPATHRSTGGHDSFETVAREWFDAQPFAKTYGPKVLARLENDVFPIIGNRSMVTIEARDVLALLRRVEARGALDMAKRIRQIMGQVFRYGIATGRAERDPTPDLRGALKPAPRVKHYTSTKDSEIGDLLDRLHERREPTAIAIEFILHTFVRSNEMRFARWEEFDDDLWRIPADRMKMKRDHIVPLTPQSKLLLHRLRETSMGSQWVLPGYKDKPVSENTLIYFLYRIGLHQKATVHGLRSTASTVLNESGLWSPDAIERQLAHSPSNKIRSAYNAAEYLPERRKMMAWWSNYIDSKDSQILV